MTNFSFEFFYEIFTEDASLLLLYHGAKKKSKMTKNSNQGGPALTFSSLTIGNGTRIMAAHLLVRALKLDQASSLSGVSG